MLQDLRRRQAPAPSRRAATGQLSCGPGINPFRSPTPPRRRGLRANRGRPEGKGGAAIGFPDAGWQGCARESVDCIGLRYAPLGSTKRTARSARFQLPRNVRFHPRVDTFYPRVHFSAGGPFLLLFLSFSERERKEEGAAGAAKRSTSRKSVRNLYPRVGGAFHGFSVDEKRGRSESGRGLAADGTSIHASTGCFPCGWPAATDVGGVHG